MRARTSGQFSKKTGVAWVGRVPFWVTVDPGWPGSSGTELLQFYHAAVTEPLARDLIVVEVSSPTAKKVPVQSHNSFLDQRS